MFSSRARSIALAAAVLLTGGAAASGLHALAAADAGSGGAQEQADVLAGGAGQTGCPRAGGRDDAFMPPCAGRSASPDGRFAVVRDAAEDSGIVLADADGRALGEIASLGDAMPFTIAWSPRPNWFFANHYLGSGLERLRVFEIAGGAAVERSALFDQAARTIVRRYPCLRGAEIAASGWRWSRDGRRIAMVVHARPDACRQSDARGEWRTGPAWDPLWMIGDAATGRIDPASVRVRRGGVGPMPTDGAYARL